MVGREDSHVLRGFYWVVLGNWGRADLDHESFGSMGLECVEGCLVDQMNDFLGCRWVGDLAQIRNLIGIVDVFPRSRNQAHGNVLDECKT